MAIDKNELKLRIEIKKLENRHKATTLALILGWIPFVIVGFFLMAGLVVAIGTGSSLFTNTGGTQVLLGIGLIAVTLSLVIFYSFAFYRRAHISARLTEKEATLEMTTGEEV